MKDQEKMFIMQAYQSPLPILMHVSFKHTCERCSLVPPLFRNVLQRPLKQQCAVTLFKHMICEITTLTALKLRGYIISEPAQLRGHPAAEGCLSDSPPHPDG